MEIVRMERRHIEKVYEIECGSFSVPWTKEALYGELNNKMAYYFVAEEGQEIYGYCGLWHVVNEGHITNIAVKQEFRGRGIGGSLMEKIIELAREKEMMGLTLEVRMNNRAAHGLYAKYGFKPEGIRKNYYSDTKEDAIVMWKYFNT